jgi:diguanylate cyclase (GGDEF)-like protein
MKVLYIDDDEIDRVRVLRLVKGTDVSLSVATSVREGVQCVAAESFDCVLVDFQLGTETAFDFLSATQGTPFATIVLTGHADDTLAMESLRHGVQDYLRKDELSSKELLLRAIRYACERKGTIQQIEQLNAKLLSANLSLRELSQHDPLTGALNRRGLADRLEVEVQRTRRSGCDLTVLFVDCDDFKIINETHGYAVGDMVLQAVSDVLQKTVRPTDHIARVGGDEFLVLLGDIRSSDAMVVAEKIEDGIRARQVLGPGGPVEISCSIGCAPVGRADVSLGAVILRAEKALKQSKAIGKDRVNISPFRKFPEGKGVEEMELINLLNCLENGIGLRVTHQPIFRLGTHAVAGHEFGVHGPPGEYERPDAFLYLAMSANRGAAIDMACLRAIRDQFKGAVLAGEGPVHVNLLPTTHLQLGIEPVMHVLRQIREASGRPICVELSERHFVGSPGDFQHLSEYLAWEGMLLALDGLRMSRSGLEALLFLEPAFLKVDRNLMIGAHLDSGHFRTLQRLVALANRRSIQSVAVGIDTCGELEIAQELGFDMAQGYYLGGEGGLWCMRDENVAHPFPL